MKKNISPAKKIAGKKRKWYFRYKLVKPSTVLKQINGFYNSWKYAGKKSSSGNRISVTRKNSQDLITVSGEEIAKNPHKYIRLNILDAYILSKWIYLKKVNFDRFNKIKIYVLNNPLLKSSASDNIENYHYFCLEQDKEFPENWKHTIRARIYIANKNSAYQILCLPNSG